MVSTPSAPTFRGAVGAKGLLLKKKFTEKPKFLAVSIVLFMVMALFWTTPIIRSVYSTWIFVLTLGWMCASMLSVFVMKNYAFPAYNGNKVAGAILLYTGYVLHYAIACDGPNARLAPDITVAGGTILLSSAVATYVQEQTRK